MALTLKSVQRPLAAPLPIAVPPATSVPPQLAYTIADVTRLTGGALNRAGVYRAAQMGRLRLQKSGRRTIVLAAELQRYLESLPDLHDGL